ncbi:M56 family metallopeptidase [Massilia sp. HP4]|uniref:M56 family metallopeptidase n=1 Tax=Massilia sp. HP4 TaxID=2562316 RepID=UPI0010C1476D|nr:M56 family metallopeptidase [Massilia sp. HP4]
MNSTHLVASIGWTLIHFLWQGALIGCAVALALFVLRKARAEHRYTVACTGLFLCLALPAAGLVLRLQDAGSSQPGAVFGAAAADPILAQGLFWDALMREHIIWIVACWAACALALALRMALGLAWIQRAAASQTGNAAWQARLDRLAAQCGVKRPVRLRLVAGLASPVTAGWWRPVVLVPASLVTGMPAHLLEALLAHEVAHIRRHDYLVNLAQNVVETLLFYHPAVWWMSGRIRAEREHIADDIAARQLGEPRRLALALSELDKLQFSTHHLAQAANGGNLMHRIKRLIRPDTQAPSWKAAVPVIGLAVFCTAVFANAQPARATAQEVDQEALVDFKSCPRPKYPEADLKARHQGTVDLGFLVGADGKIKENKVTKSSGHPGLDEAARSVLVTCSFKPALANGKPVQAWTKVSYVWQLH